MAQQQFTCALVIAMLVVVVGQVNCGLPAGFERCDSSAIVEKFSVSACPDGATPESPCKLKPFDGLGIKIEFISGKNFDSVYSHMDLTNYGEDAHSTLLAAHKVYGTSMDACRLGLRCPGTAGISQDMKQLYYFGNELLDAIKSDTMEFYLSDAKTHERLVCIRFPVAIVAK